MRQSNANTVLIESSGNSAEKENKRQLLIIEHGYSNGRIISGILHTISLQYKREENVNIIITQ